MKLSRFFSFLALAAFCSMIFSATAAARPNIAYHVDNVSFVQGEATISGYFENTGDTDAYAKWFKFDLILTADNGQQMWAGYGIFHELDDIYVPANSAIEYTFYVQDPDIPEYYGDFYWQVENERTHWDTSAG